MDKKRISLVPCNGLIPEGLIARTACTDMVEEHENMISICITAAGAELEGIGTLVSKYPIITVNCCENECTNKILANKGIKAIKTINTTKILNKENLKPKNISRLDLEDEKCVEAIKIKIKEFSKDM